MCDKARRRRLRSRRRRTGRIQNQKQDPHTKLWGKRTDIIAQRVLFVRTLAFHRWICLLLNSVPALRLTLTHQSSLRLFQSQLSQAKKSQYTVYVCLLLTTLETAESASQCAGPVQHSRYAFEGSLNPWVLNGADSISHAQSSGIPEKD